MLGVTIIAENAFWDQAGKRWRTSKGFHIIDKVWLRSREEDAMVREREGCAAYIIWGEDIWNSMLEADRGQDA